VWFFQDVLPTLVVLLLLWPSVGMVRDRGWATEFYEFLGIPLRFRRYVGIFGIVMCALALIGIVGTALGIFPITI
jgi:hypothetical protein